MCRGAGTVSLGLRVYDAAMRDATVLVAIKAAHTLIWAFLAGSILAIPVLAALGQWRLTAALAGVVLLECVVLAANGMKCPLTSVAERYTDDRSDNFDIWLPAWLARNNKRIFGTLFVAGLLFAVVSAVARA